MSILPRGDDAPLTPRQRVVSFASVGDLDDGRRTRPTSPDEPLSDASLARRLINPWPEGSPGMKVKVPRDYVRWDRCRGREPGDDEYVVGEAVNVRNGGASYEINFFDSYTEWMPRYRFSVVP
mmetsp:Transcript_3253/g.9816  ORF Transcript_3253/g.9816 Transcript_3253/m.9816 type:complete len:123 (-) Transcript_3253:206-574(-)